MFALVLVLLTVMVSSASANVIIDPPKYPDIVPNHVVIEPPQYPDVVANHVIISPPAYPDVARGSTVMVQDDGNIKGDVRINTD